MDEIMNSRMEIGDRSQIAGELKNVQATGTCSLTNFDKFPFSFGLNASDTPSSHYWIVDS